MFIHPIVALANPTINLSSIESDSERIPRSLLRGSSLLRGEETMFITMLTLPYPPCPTQHED